MAPMGTVSLSEPLLYRDLLYLSSFEPGFATPRHRLVVNTTC